MAFFILKVNFQKRPRVFILTTGIIIIITAGSRRTNSQSELEILPEAVHAI